MRLAKRATYVENWCLWFVDPLEYSAHPADERFIGLGSACGRIIAAISSMISTTRLNQIAARKVAKKSLHRLKNIGPTALPITVKVVFIPAISSSNSGGESETIGDGDGKSDDSA